METLLELGGLSLSLLVAKHLPWFSFTEQDLEFLPALSHFHQSYLQFWLRWMTMMVMYSGDGIIEKSVGLQRLLI